MNILYVMYRFPYPLDRGDKLRAFNQIKFLSKSNKIFLCSITNDFVTEAEINILKQYCENIFIFSIPQSKIYINFLKNLILQKPIQNAYVFDKNIDKKINEIITDKNIDHAISLMVRPADYLANKKIKTTLDYQDTLSIGFKRRSESLGFFKKIVYKLEALLLKKYEHDLFDKFDNKIIITDEDRTLFPHPERENIQIVGNGIDLDYFTPKSLEKTYDLIFVGNMSYEPNIVSMHYLVNNIFPLIKKEMPQVKLLIAGADPVESVKKLASDDIVVSGRIDDIRQAYDSGKIFIAPMQLGTGLQNKLLEAMAMCLPVITSELCNKALGGTEGKHLLIGRSDKEYVDYCIELLTNPAKAEKLAHEAYIFVKENFSWEAINAELERIISK